MADIDGVNLLDIAGIERLQHRNEPAGGDVVGNMEEREPGQALSSQRQAPRALAVADRDAAMGRQEDALAVDGEGPGVAVPGEIEGDEIAAGEFLGMIRSSARGEIIRRGDDRRDAFAELARDELRGSQRPDPDRDIGALVDEVDHRIGDRDVQLDAGMRRHEARRHRQQEMPAEGDIRVHPQSSARNLAGGDRPLGLVEIGQHAQGPLVEGRAFLGEHELAGRTHDQPDAEPRLQPGDELADGRGRHPQGARGRREAAELDDAREHLHLARSIDLAARHREFISQLLVFHAV